MTDPNRFTAHFGEATLPGSIRALEGGRGNMRVFLDWSSASVDPRREQECVLEMHDGARFRTAITEALGEGPDGRSGEFRLKLLGRA